MKANDKKRDDCMKKIVLFLLTGCLAAGLLAGCGAGAPAEDTGLESTVSEVTEEKAFKPTQAEVEAARALALEGMSEAEVTRITEFVKTANRAFESICLGDLDIQFEQLSDKDALYWNRFVTKGKEVQIGWMYDAELDKAAICRDENLTEEEFYEKYAAEIITDVEYDLNDLAAKLEELKSAVHNEALRTDLQTLADLARETQAERKYENFQLMLDLLHDMDYFLLRYGPSMAPTFEDPYDQSYLTTYNGTLTIYQ